MTFNHADEGSSPSGPTNKIYNMFDLSQIESKYSLKDRLDKLSTIEFLEEYSWTYFKYTPSGHPSLMCRNDPYGIYPLYEVIFSKNKIEPEYSSEEYTLINYLSRKNYINLGYEYLIASVLLPLNLRKNILNFFIGYYYLDICKTEAIKTYQHTRLSVDPSIWIYSVDNKTQVCVTYSPKHTYISDTRSDLLSTFFINVPKDFIYRVFKK